MKFINIYNAEIKSHRECQGNDPTAHGCQHSIFIQPLVDHTMPDETIKFYLINESQPMNFRYYHLFSKLL